MKYLKNNQQFGTALISTLILILFITSTISIWIHQSQSHIRQQRIKQENQQAILLLQGANIWAAQTLKTKSFHKRQVVIAKLDPAQLPMPRGWRIEANLEDAQSKFNINNVNEPAMQLSFFLLLQNQLKNIPQVPLKTIFYSTIKKVEPVAEAKHEMLPKNEDKDDANFDPIAQPYVTLTEWHNTEGVNPLIFKTMEPYLTVLPETTPININTCRDELLAALKPGLKKADVKRLIYARGDEGFKRMDELFEVMQELKLPVQNITINSQYFWLNIKLITPSQRRLFFRDLLFRQISSKNKSAKINLISQFQLH